jgi:hypothetical protein
MNEGTGKALGSELRLEEQRVFLRRYRPLGEIGASEMGGVHEVLDSDIGWRLAMKFVHSGGIEDPAQGERRQRLPRRGLAAR